MGRIYNFILVIIVLVLRVSPSWAQEAGLAAPLYLSMEQRVLVSYALLAQGEGDEKKFQILNRLNEYKNKYLAKGAQQVSVENFEQFLEIYRGQWPNTNSLELDMQIIESEEARGLFVYTAKSPRIQRKIDQFLKDKNRELVAMALKNKGAILSPDEDFAAKVFSFAGDLVKDKERSLLMNAAKAALDMSDQILARQMSELDRIGTKISQLELGTGQNLSTKILLQTVFGEYFARLSPASKKLIVAAYLGGDLKSDDMQKFEVMIQNSGPQLQKILQVVASQADIDPAVQVIFKKLENSVKPVPWVQVEEILKAEKDNYDFTYFERKSLGIGTMAQVHRAKVNINGKRHDVVVRFIKPGIAQRVQEDHRILVEVAKILDGNPEFRQTGMPQLGPMVDDITKTVTAELSQEDTILRQRVAAKAYDQIVPLQAKEYKGDLEFHVPEIFPAKEARPSQLMVQEMVIGSKFDKEVVKYQDLMPDLKRVIAEQIARMWLNELLFGSGFYHSDLHQGNFMVRVGEPATEVSLLDFGMGGVISADTQSRVLLLGLGVDTLNARLITESFWAISDKNKNKLDEDSFRGLVEARVQDLQAQKARGQAVSDMTSWTVWATEQGIGLPYDFINLNRGLGILSKLLQDAGSRESMTTLTKKLVAQNPLRTAKVFSQVGKFSLGDWARLGWSQLIKKPSPLIPPLNSPSAAPAVPSVSRCESIFSTVTH